MEQPHVKTLYILVVLFLNWKERQVEIFMWSAGILGNIRKSVGTQTAQCLLGQETWEPRNHSLPWNSFSPVLSRKSFICCKWLDARLLFRAKMSLQEKDHVLRWSWVCELFIPTWQMLLNKNDKPPTRKPKGAISICMWHRGVNALGTGTKRLYIYLL